MSDILSVREIIKLLGTRAVENAASLVWLSYVLGNFENEERYFLEDSEICDNFISMAKERFESLTLIRPEKDRLITNPFSSLFANIVDAYNEDLPVDMRLCEDDFCFEKVMADKSRMQVISIGFRELAIFIMNNAKVGSSVSEEIRIITSSKDHDDFVANLFHERMKSLLRQITSTLELPPI